MLICVLLINVVSCDLLPALGLGGGGGDVERDDSFYINSPLTVDLLIGDSLTLELIIGDDLDGEVVWTSSSSCVTVDNGVVTAHEEGVAIIKAILGDRVGRVIINVKSEEDSSGENNGNSDGDLTENQEGETIYISTTNDPITSDPYAGVDEDEFYDNYTPAISYNDAYYRTKHNLMSGSIEKQDQAPTISPYRPKIDGTYVRNNLYIFSEDGNTYYVVDCYGEIAFEVYRGGAYVILEEVAAYVFAFGEPPANHSASKKTSPASSAWGEYLRVNNTKFSGSTTKYPYEPELPRISGCGGDLTYYEMDIGTTGTDCDPDYEITDYNNGYKITRGAARIVYSCKDSNGNKIIDLDERYVFYTYNHYNDFQEYLNYEGGWGEMFGNVTGGGTLSSKYNYNPTPYVTTARAKIGKAPAVILIYYYVPKESLAA